jgi:hypothetical protein
MVLGQHALDFHPLLGCCVVVVLHRDGRSNRSGAADDDAAKGKCDPLLADGECPGLDD